MHDADLLCAQQASIDAIRDQHVAKEGGLGRYFSAYNVDSGMIDALEALLVRGFANDLLNVKMETFAHSRQ